LICTKQIKEKVVTQMLSIGRSAQLVLLYCTVNDLLKRQARQGQSRKSNNKPRFTDAEVLVIALMQSYFRTDTLKRTYLPVKTNDPTALRQLPSDKQWINRLDLWAGQSGEMIFSVPRRIEDEDFAE
jgi:hypothetical protein